MAKEQLEDDRLKHCWRQVRVIEGKDVQPPPHPTPHFVFQNGLLYCVAQRRGEEVKLLVAAPLQNRDHSGTHPFSSDGGPLRGTKHGATHQRQVSLARVGCGGQAVLPGLPRLPADLTTNPSPISADSTSHYWGALWADRDGSSRAAAEVCPGTWAHPGHRGLCHPVPWSYPSAKSHVQGHRPGTVPIVQPGRHTPRDIDRPRHPLHVPDDGWPLPPPTGKTAPYHRLPPSDRWVGRTVQ